MARAPVFKDFIVVIEDKAGQRRASMTTEEFRTASGCSRTAFVADCIAQYNARQERDGAEDRARLDMRVEQPRSRRRR